MRTDFPVAALELAWRPARAAGVVGSAPIEEIREHTAGFLSAVCSFFAPDAPLRALDVGSGAGIPGLFLAWELPHSSWILLDSSLRRCEMASSAVLAVGLDERTAVVHGRSDEPLPDVSRGTMDLVVARLLGSASETLELCAPFCRPGGLVVASVAARDRAIWSTATDIPGVDGAHVSSHGDHTFVAVSIGEGLDPALPRRPKARGRRPLLGA